MDPSIGIVEGGDILIERDTIIDVRSGGSRPDGWADVPALDLAGQIAIPGFVDTHRHCWQTPLRRLIPDVDDMAGYLAATHKSLALHYRPEDMFLASYLASLGAIDNGITSLVDFSHNSRTTAHAVAALDGLVASGIRGTIAYGPALSGEWDWRWPGDLGHLIDIGRTRGEGRTDVRLAVQGSPHFAGEETTLSRERLALAREHGVGVSVDGVIGEAASHIVEDLGSAGDLAADVTLIHCQAISERAWDLIAESGAGVSLTVTSDAQIGIGQAIAPIEQCLARDILPSLSVDVETVLPGDMITQMRVLLAIQRMMVTHRADGVTHRIGVEDVLRYATVGGARVNGSGDRTGSITPGRKADLVTISTAGVSTFPSNDPIGTVVSGVDSSGIDSVMIGGVFRKRGGRLVDVDLLEVRERAEKSRVYLMAAAGIAAGER
jgi:cytosine/adenosine deaminase-related metal-dependent hydrolase